MNASRSWSIGDYGLIGDTRSAALVAPDGGIDWLCLPRFDSWPVFARLVAGEDGGTLSITPDVPIRSIRRSYRDSTATLETTWEVDGSEVVLADAMIAEVCGQLLPGTVLVRRVRVRGAAVPMRVRIEPRFEHGRAARTRRVGDGLVLDAGPLALSLSADFPVQAPPSEWLVDASPTRPLTMVLTATDRGPAILVPPATGCDAAHDDERRWEDWAAGIVADVEHRSAIVRSLITLQLLTYSPSGAPVAAPTTSLPEVIGGSRNWDYRYAWPRDASIGVDAFLSFGKHRDAGSFLDWLVHATRVARPQLPPMFDLDGRPVPAERSIDHWPGYSGSRPVRFGNNAGTQTQLDGYGWLIDAAARYAAAGHRLNGETWRMVAAYTDEVATIWREPDAGIWERRDDLRHHVHSKLMAWLGLDRAVAIAANRRGGRAARRRRSWLEQGDALAAEIRARGFSEDVGAYTAAYGSDSLDSALLLLPSIGFDPPSSPRVTGTIDAIQRELSAGGPFLYRYVDDDGLEGREGAFLPCSFWLVDALAHIGRVDQAREMFEQLIGLGGSLGLYSEEIDPTSGASLGNFPQALTHSAMVQAASTLQSIDRG